MMMKTRRMWSEKEDSALRLEVSKQGEIGQAPDRGVGQVFAESPELMDVLATTVTKHGEVKNWRCPAASLPGRNNKGAHTLPPEDQVFG